jgi:WD40 repeat protein
VAVATHEPAPPAGINPEVPRALSDLVMRLLEKDRSQRPASAGEVVAQLQALEKSLGGASATDRPRAHRAPELPTFAFGAESEKSSGRRSGAATRPRVAVSGTRPARKHSSKRLLPFVLGGVSLLAVALVVAFVVMLGRGKKDGPGLVERGNEAAPDPVGEKKGVIDKDDQKPSVRPGEKDSPDKNKDESTINPNPNVSREPPIGKDNPKDADPIGEVRQFNGHTGGIWTVDLSPDGRLALSGSGWYWKDGIFTDAADKSVRVWDVKTGKELHCFYRHSGNVRNVAFSLDSRQAAACGETNGAILLWDVEKGKELHQFPGHKVVLDRLGNWLGAIGVAFVPGSSQLASVGADGALRIWDTASGKMAHEYHLGVGEIHCIAITPDGRSAFCGTNEKLAYLVDLATGKVLRRYEGQTSLLHSIAVSPDGQLLLSGGHAGKAVLWSVADGKKIAEFDGHAVRFSKDGKRILVGCDDSTVRLVATSDRRELHRFRGHTTLVQGVAFSPDGRYGLSGSWDGTLRLWKLPANEADPVSRPPSSPLTRPTSDTTDRKVAKKVLELGGRVTILLQATASKIEIRNVADLPGQDFFLSGIDLSENEKLYDGVLPQFAKLSRLTWLNLLTRNKGELSDNALVHLKGITTLNGLILGGSRARITDTGLANLSGLVNLESLFLDGTQVTNGGLKHLRGMTKLRTLELNHLKGVTDEGLAELSVLSNLNRLSLPGTGVSDAGLAHLCRIKTLTSVYLNRTKVTAEGVKRLKASLPSCRVMHLIPIYKVVSPLRVELTTDAEHVKRIAQKFPGHFSGAKGHHQSVLGYAYSTSQPDARRLRCYYNRKSKRYVYSTERVTGAVYVEKPMNAWVPTKQWPGISPRYIFSKPGIEDDHEYGWAGLRDGFRKAGFSSDKQLCLMFDNP